MQVEISQQGPLLKPDGTLAQVGWSRCPMLDCNLEDARSYIFRPLQFLRIKRWDYYAVFSPRRFFSATVADLGYAGNVFVYTLDFESGELHEEGLVIPFGKGIVLPRNSTEGVTSYRGKGVEVTFSVEGKERRLFLDWPGFHDGRGIRAEITLSEFPEHESMNIVIPIGRKRFYFNRKINCLLASGYIQYGDIRGELEPDESLGSLDWGRGVWQYRSYWNWASASGYLHDGRCVGLNLGRGFGDTSAPTENAMVVDGRIHKLGEVAFEYDSSDYMGPWRFRDDKGRLALTFGPFKERVAKTNLGIIASEVHQTFGRYSGEAILENGEALHIRGLIGFAEEHRARW